MYTEQNGENEQKIAIGGSGGRTESISYDNFNRALERLRCGQWWDRNGRRDVKRTRVRLDDVRLHAA